ncbi:MAG: single-stranded DNA-binding protein, partial [Planctomycetota bacterium]
GRRLWGLMQERYPDAGQFFDEHFVANYCPLVFMEESARNLTPDKLTAAVRSELESHCDEHLAGLIEALQPEFLIGVGAFAENCGKRVIEKVGLELQVGRILHPSPASPAANKDWAGTATKQLEKLGIW